MRPTSLSREQQDVVFYLLEGSSRTGLELAIEVQRWALRVLGYQIAPDGTRVHSDIPITFQYGEDVTGKWKDTVTEDWEELRREIAKDKDTADSGTGESTEGN